MKNELNDIIDDVKIAYKEAVLLNNKVLEDRLFSILNKANFILNSLGSKKEVQTPDPISDEDVVLDDFKEVEKVKKGLPKWIYNQHQPNFQILSGFMKLLKSGKQNIAVYELEEEANIDKFYSNYNQMKTTSGENSIKIFEERSGMVKLWEPVAHFIIKEFQKVGL